MDQIKDYLGSENGRNKLHAGLYERLIKRALRNKGIMADVSVLIGHHLCFEINGDLSTENEIPAADTLIFDHELMGAVFGSSALIIMQDLAALPTRERDLQLEEYLELLEQAEGEQNATA